ncbi:MAG: hypothetical protein HY360_17315 [Verrucomicrobia bacterium]|nr:hypothetical protein [Verrucomicrobiota bacterium]
MIPPEGDNPDDKKPMDEFQWEKFLKQSDALTDKYMEVLDKFKDHPERDRMVAREMGWHRLDEALDAQESGGAFMSEGSSEDFEDLPPLEPNPLTEDVDWVRDEEGHVHHPLTLRMLRVSVGMCRYCDDRGLLEDGGDVDLHEMILEAQIAGVKLAGALDRLPYDHDQEGGFIVACLKRALTHLHQSIGAAAKVADKQCLDRQTLETFRAALFAVRQETLALMNRFRKQS